MLQMREATPGGMLVGGRSHNKYMTGLWQDSRVHKAGRVFYSLSDKGGNCGVEGEAIGPRFSGLVSSKVVLELLALLLLGWGRGFLALTLGWPCGFRWWITPQGDLWEWLMLARSTLRVWVLALLQAAWVWTPALSFTSCVTLAGSLYLFVPNIQTF